MGNLVPLMCVLPFAISGAALLYRYGVTSLLGLSLCVLALVVGWIAVNAFGLWGNRALKAELAKKLLAKAGRNASDGIFVGFARPAYMGLLDAHEDLGFLFIDPEGLEYVGEIHHVTLDKSDVKGVRYRGNIHALMGLGRWVSIEAVHKGKPVRVLVEPREYGSLLKNKQRGTALREDLEKWLKPGTVPR